MDYQKAIENHINECRHRVDVIRNHMNTNGGADTDKCLENIQVLETVIFAMNELQMYKDGKLCLIPENVYSKQCTELDTYKHLGTLEEVRGAVEKQKEERPIAVLGTFGGEEHECRECGNTVEYMDEYCKWCGKKLDWSEEDEQ